MGRPQLPYSRTLPSGSRQLTSHTSCSSATAHLLEQAVQCQRSYKGLGSRPPSQVATQPQPTCLNRPYSASLSSLLVLSGRVLASSATVKPRRQLAVRSKAGGKGQGAGVGLPCTGARSAGCIFVRKLSSTGGRWQQGRRRSLMRSSTAHAQRHSSVTGPQQRQPRQLVHCKATRHHNEIAGRHSGKQGPATATQGARPAAAAGRRPDWRCRLPLHLATAPAGQHCFPAAQQQSATI